MKDLKAETLNVHKDCQPKRFTRMIRLQTIEHNILVTKRTPLSGANGQTKFKRKPRDTLAETRQNCLPDSLSACGVHTCTEEKQFALLAFPTPAVFISISTPSDS